MLVSWLAKLRLFSMPKLVIRKEDGKYVIRDDGDTCYGKYDKKDDAEIALEGWKAYYAV
jgi:hypothetical protein